MSAPIELPPGIEVMVSRYLTLVDPDKPSPMNAGAVVIALTYRNKMPGLDQALNCPIDTALLGDVWRNMTEEEIVEYKLDENSAEEDDE